MGSLTVLSVAYPFAPVCPETAGGAEQVLAMLDEALQKGGHRSLVIAAKGSQVKGTLQPIPVPPGEITTEVRARTWALVREAIVRVLAASPVDVIHMHGIDFLEYLPPEGVAALVTLHLPLSWYPDTLRTLSRAKTWLHCVSPSQNQSAPAGLPLLDPIANGVSEELFRRGVQKQKYALSLGRICPEKGYHMALDAASRANVPYLLAGQVYPYQEHQQYYREQILSRLNRSRRFIGAVGPRQKRRLLTAARCLLIPSTAPETSSLVAMESLMCGTPVVAFPAGALPEIVEHGKTGFLVETPEEMAEAIHHCDRISPDACRQSALEQFESRRTVTQYLDRYGWLAAQ